MQPTIDDLDDERHAEGEAARVHGACNVLDERRARVLRSIHDAAKSIARDLRDLDGIDLELLRHHLTLQALDGSHRSPPPPDATAIEFAQRLKRDCSADGLPGTDLAAWFAWLARV